MLKETIENSAKPEKVLHLDTPKEPLLWDLSKFRTKPQKAS